MESTDRTYIGIDYGSRRTGVAKSDPTGLIASALVTIEARSRRHLLDQLHAVVDEHKPVGLVVGYPLLPSGDRSAKCDEVDRFVAGLKEFYGGSVHMVDESYTSVDAADIIHAHGKRVGRDKKRIDRLAAVIILQRFLDERQQEQN
ncbi:MAG: Holliday junction resolvase RuvX [Candidatus Zixiibacteriota bacterium]